MSGRWSAEGDGGRGGADFTPDGFDREAIELWREPWQELVGVAMDACIADRGSLMGVDGADAK